MKRMLGFVLVATVVGPPGSPRQTCSALVGGKQSSATTPDSRRQHFILRGWPSRPWGLAYELIARGELPSIRLGHADPSMTLRVYAHAVEGADASLAATLAIELLGDTDRAL